MSGDLIFVGLLPAYPDLVKRPAAHPVVVGALRVSLSHSPLALDPFSEEVWLPGVEWEALLWLPGLACCAFAQKLVATTCTPGKSDCKANFWSDTSGKLSHQLLVLSEGETRRTAHPPYPCGVGLQSSVGTCDRNGWLVAQPYHTGSTLWGWETAFGCPLALAPPGGLLTPPLD